MARQSRIASRFRVRWPHGLAVTVLIAASAGGSVGHAEEAASIVRHGAWQAVTTGGASGCFAVQTVVGRRSGAVLIQAVLAPLAGDDGVRLRVKVPTGAYLPDGIAYRHAPPSKRGIGLEWQDCDAERCTAEVNLSQDEMALLKRGREIVFGYRPLPNSPVLNVPLSLMGLTAAWRDVERCASDGG